MSLYIAALFNKISINKRKQPKQISSTTKTMNKKKKKVRYMYGFKKINLKRQIKKVIRLKGPKKTI